MATSRTDIISEIAISYMRAMDLAFSITNAKPNTKLYAFFDGVSVDPHIKQNTKDKGVNVVTDAAGLAAGTFTINDFTYSTGTKGLKFQDTPNFFQTNVPGSTVSSAEANFTSVGTLRSTQDTETSINTIVEVSTIENNVIGALGDPLAQSFFTHGVTGGVNITKIDIFFQSKEPNGSIPVTLEIREVIGGYPSVKLASVFSRVVINPADIKISSDASIPTAFIFDTPIFLPENRDWCFVLLSNSDKYNVWTAKIGERSQETGLTIFEQPFIGTMFKSENNVTWTTDSTEDIKFNIHQALYNVMDGASTTFKAKANKILVYGKNLNVVTGSNLIELKLNYLHGLRNGDKIRILAPIGSPTIGYSNYRGISASQISGLYTATYIDEYTVNIQLNTGLFTSTGTLEIPGIINEIQIDSGGSGYTTTPTIEIIGACTTTATATVQTVNGIITGVTITNRGAGYLVKPALVLSGIGSGASLALICETVLQVETNRVYDEVLPRIAKYTPALSSVTSLIKTTSVNYEVQNEIASVLNVNAVLPKKSLLLSIDNANTFLTGQSTTEIVLKMQSENINVSPLISLSENPSLECKAYIINNQTDIETINPSITHGSAAINSISISSSGSGYTSTGITISAPDISSGTPATATAVLTGGVVTGIVINNSGSGYITRPSVTMTQVLGTAAVLFPILTSFNTEVLSTGGTAKSRYVTKPISLNTVSTGAIIYANAFSSVYSSFDFYIRTSLRSDNTTHTTLPWKMMLCDVTRNKSNKPNEMLDYTFYVNYLNSFDVYDLKIVLRTTDRLSIPYLKNYRCIILAT